MFWYVFICCLLALVYISWRASSKRNSWKNLALLLMFIILWFFASFRATSVGADTKNYLSLFEQLRGCSLSALPNIQIPNWEGRYFINWEFGFKLLMWLYLHIFFFVPTRGGLAFISFLVFFFWYKAIKRMSPNPLLSVWLYMTLAFFQTGLNMAQNALAISLVIWAIRFINEEKPFKWILVISIATSIHNSSFIFIPLYWMARIQFNKKNIIVWILGLAMASLFSNIILRIALRFVPTQYYLYLRTDKTAWEELAVLLLHLALITIVSLYRLKASRHGFKYSVNYTGTAFIQPYFVFFFCEVGFYVMTLSAKGLLRAATLFSPSIVLYLPHLINTIEKPRNKSTCTVIIIIFSLVCYIARMFVNNIGTTQPYLFYFS